MAGLLADIMDLRGRIGLRPTRLDVQQTLDLLAQVLLIHMLEGAALTDPATGEVVATPGRAEIMQMVFGGRIAAEPDAIYRELADLGRAYRLSGEHFSDGAFRRRDYTFRDRNDMPPVNERDEIGPPAPP